MLEVLIILLIVIAGLYLFNKLTFPGPRGPFVKGIIEAVVVVLTLLWLVIGFWTPPSWGPLSHRWERGEPAGVRYH